MGIIGQFDQAVLNIMDGLPAALHLFMVVITDIGSPVSCSIILGINVLWAYVHKSRQLTIASTVLLLAMPVANLLKELIKRTRPDTAYVQTMLFKTYSFPSGHAYASFLAYGLFAYLICRHMRSAWKWLVIAGLILFIVLVGISRIYLGAHFPSDVLGGWILGAIILYIIVIVCYKDPQNT